MSGERAVDWVGFERVHYYSLAARFFGRVAELAELDAWLAQAPDAISVRCLCALGGGGKSALAWHWLERALPSLPSAGYRGAFWCSFYEKDFDFGDFLRRALAFAARIPRDVVAQMPRVEVEDRLIEVMAREPFVFVVDGLERLMNGYAIVFDRAVDPDSIQRGKLEADVTPYDRSMSDPRTGVFLGRLARPLASRVLITTRLGPSELEQAPGRPLPHVKLMQLGGLAPREAEDLWRDLVPNGRVTDKLRAVLTLSGNHPLVISILARSVAASGGDWEAWRALEQHRDVGRGEGKSDAEIRSAIIGVCLRDLDERSYDVLGALTTSGKPMPLALLAELLLGGSAVDGDERWTTQEQVAAEVDRLVSLGFVWLMTVGEVKEYDVHPVVRGAAWKLITEPTRERFLTHALSEFFATPDRQDKGADLNKAMTLFRLLVKTNELDRAWDMYANKLWSPLMAESDNQTLLDLLDLMRPPGDAMQLLPLAQRREQANATEMLGMLLMNTGDGGRADRLLRWCGAIRLQLGELMGFLNARHHRSWQTMYEGRLFEAEVELRGMRDDALRFRAQEIIPSIECWIGMVLALRGQGEQAREQFKLAQGRISHRWWAQGVAEGYVYLADHTQALHWLEEARRVPLAPGEGRSQEAWEHLTRGMAEFQAGRHEAAFDHLSRAKTESANTSYPIIQCFAIPYIAAILLERGLVDAAEGQLEAYFLVDRERRYRLAATDVLRVRALCKLKRGDRAGAAADAAEAYRLAACDGPPFVYKEGLGRALDTLAKCGAYVPRTEARLVPDWREVLAEVTPPAGGEEEAEAPVLSVEEARELLREEPILQDASADDRRWWAQIMKDAPPEIDIPLAQALQALRITLAQFRGAYERSEYKSVLVVFHTLVAERIVPPDALRPVRALDDAARARWLADGDEQAAAVAGFLATELAQRVAANFDFHGFDEVGVNAFLADDKRRIGHGKGGFAAAWWDQLERLQRERKRSPVELLVLAECIALSGLQLDEVVETIATGTPRGIEYAFEAIRVRQLIKEITVDVISNTESWTDVQIFLRLEDVKQKIGWRDAGQEARDDWTAFEKRERHRLAHVLRVAEELAIRRATVEDYRAARVFTKSDSVQANLSYVDYKRLKDKPWDGQWPGGGKPIYPDTTRFEFSDSAGWEEKKVQGRLGMLLKKLERRNADSEAARWWGMMKAQYPSRVVLRLTEELDARGASIRDFYLAFSYGATVNLAALLAYLEVRRQKQFEEQQKAERASAFNSEGNELYEEERYRDATAAYEEAIALKPNDSVFYTNLASAWRNVEDLTPSEALARVIEVLERGKAACTILGDIPKELEAAWVRKRLIDHGAYPNVMRMLPVVTPIAGEVGGKMKAIAEGATLPTHLLDLRAKIERETGVYVPSVRFRANTSGDLPEDTWIFMLDEVPLVMGKLTTPDDPEKTWQELRDALEAFIRKHLAHFVTHETVAQRLQKTELKLLEKPGGTPQAEYLDGVLKDIDLLGRFTRVLKALVQEGVPVLPFVELAQPFVAWTPQVSKVMEQTVGPQPPHQWDIDETLQKLRLAPEIRRQLPGQTTGTLVGVAPKIEQQVLANLHPYGDERVLLLEPDATQDLLRAFRAVLNDVPDKPAVVVVDSGLARRYLWRVLELEFPDAVVLSRAELDAGNQRTIWRQVEED